MTNSSSIATAPGALPLLGHLVPLLEAVVLPLALALQRLGVRVWLGRPVRG